MAAPSVPASATSAVKAPSTSGVKASTTSVEAPKAGLSSGCVASRNPSVVEPAEGAGMRSLRRMRDVGPTTPPMAVKAPAVSVDSMIVVRVKVIAIDDSPAVRDVGIVVVDDSPFVVPIVVPMVPTPAEAAEESDPESQSKTDPRAIPKESRIRIPAREDRQGIPVHEPGIVLRDINHVARRGLDNDRVSLGAYLLLVRRLQVPSLLSPLSHGLKRLRQILVLVDMGVPQF